jgi:hypothetical protein
MFIDTARTDELYELAIAHTGSPPHTALFDRRVLPSPCPTPRAL